MTSTNPNEEIPTDPSPRDDSGSQRVLSPFGDVFPVTRSLPSSKSPSSVGLSTSSSLDNYSTPGLVEINSLCDVLSTPIQQRVHSSTRFALADLLITVLRLDFYKKGDQAAEKFCETALEITLKWSELPEKTNETLKHHMHDDGSANEDIATLIDVIRKDDFCKENGVISLLGSVLITIIENGDYDSRYRVLLHHICALLGVLWDKFEEFEDTLSNRLLYNYIESDDSRTKREKLAKNKKYKRYALIGAAGGLGAVLIGLTGGFAAPFVAGSIGTIAGIPAITALATAPGAAAAFGSVLGAAGGGLASYRMKKRVGAIEEFVVESLSDNQNPSLHCVLCVSGWIEENDERAFQRQWRHLWHKEQYTLRYESKYLEDWGKAMEYFVSIAVYYAIQRSLMETVLAGVFSAIAWPLVLVSSSSIIDNPWNVCFSRTVEVGEHLAEVLLTRAHGRRPITLIGFSLGARVIYHCLLAMSKRGVDAIGIVEDVVLLGAPVSASPSQWKQICKVVGGRVINGYCNTDWLLRFLYRTASAQFTIAGTGPVDNKDERKIVNFNLSHIVKGHLEYSKKLTEILDAVGIKVTPLSKGSRSDLEKYLEQKSNKEEAQKELEREWPQQYSEKLDDDDPLSIKMRSPSEGENPKMPQTIQEDQPRLGSVEFALTLDDNSTVENTCVDRVKKQETN